MNLKELTRRKLLAGVGTAGAATAGVRFGSGRFDYTAATGQDVVTPADGEGRIRVGWYEEYNGRPLETQGDETNATRALDPAISPEYVGAPARPVMAVDNVLPGDAGKLLVGVSVEELPADDGVEAVLAVRLRSDVENGVTEPERKAAGEDGTASGELADALRMVVWLDGGVAGVGACDGRRVGESTLASGSLREVCEALRDGRVVGDGCLSAGNHRCLGLAWSLPSSTGNSVQTDGVTFDLTVGVRDCGGEGS